MLELLKLWIRNITLSGQLSNSADVHLPWKCCKANESLFQIANLSQFWGCLLGLITAISSDFQQPTTQSNLTWIHLGSGSSHMSLSICPFLQQPNREIMQLELNNKKMGVFIFICKKQQVFFIILNTCSRRFAQASSNSCRFHSISCAAFGWLEVSLAASTFSSRTWWQ